MTRENKGKQGLKVVVEEVGTSVAMGVQAKDCDPHFVVLPDVTLEQALLRVPELIAVAQERWAMNPRRPAYQRPPEPAKPAPASSTPRATTPAASKPKQPEVVRPQLM